MHEALVGLLVSPLGRLLVCVGLCCQLGSVFCVSTGWTKCRRTEVLVGLPPSPVQPYPPSSNAGAVLALELASLKALSS